MNVKVNTDNHIEGSERLSAFVESVVKDTLNHFTDQITWVEVHLGDENSTKEGGADKRCALQVKVDGRPSVTVTHYADTLDQAIDGAAEKMKRSLESSLGKLRNH